MANTKIQDAELAERVAVAFRTFGYEGASLHRLAEASGLEKASLYYRFPGGKDAILQAVLEHVGAWFEVNIFTPLRQPGPLAERVRQAGERLRQFYGDGSKPCVLDTLSLRGGSDAFQTVLRAALAQWLRTFTDIAIESGAEPEEAVRRAEQAVMAVEGSLVLTRVTGESRYFLSAIDALGTTLLGA